MAISVVFVPGVLGSVLGYRDDMGKVKRVWYSQQYMILNGPGDMQLSVDGSGPGPLNKVGPLVAVKEVPDWGPYAALFARLQSEGWAPDFFAYDWRQPLQDSSVLLADYLLETYRERDYYVLCHSMGGLVSRLAFPRVTAAGGAARWKRTVYTGVPQYGSYQAAEYLSVPDQRLPMWGSLGLALAGPLFSLVSSRVISSHNKDARATVATWPALYELLPDVSAPWRPGRPLDDQLYIAANYHSQNPSVSQTWLDAAKVTRTEINATLAEPQPPTRTVIGTRIDTPGTVIRGSHFGDPASYGEGSGDGSVMALRAELGGSPTMLVMPNAVHADMLADPRYLNLITSLLLQPDITGITMEPLKEPIMPLAPPPEMIIPAPLTFIDLQRRGDP